MTSKPRKLKKVLVANRGEIAVRVFRACAEMGIATAAIYSDADQHAIHARYADEAHRIGPAAPTESYLALDRIVMREALVLDVSYKSAGQGVTGDDLERTGVRPGPGQIAVIKTSWTDRAYGKPEFWNNTIHLEPSVGEWVERQGVSAVAMD